MPDGYALKGELSSPAAYAEVPVNSDTANLAFNSRSVYVGGAGNLSVCMANGANATFVAVQAGSILPIRVARINTTGTTATNILSLR